MTRAPVAALGLCAAASPLDQQLLHDTTRPCYQDRVLVFICRMLSRIVWVLHHAASHKQDHRSWQAAQVAHQWTPQVPELAATSRADLVGALCHAEWLAWS